MPGIPRTLPALAASLCPRDDGMGSGYRDFRGSPLLTKPPELTAHCSSFCSVFPRVLVWLLFVLYYFSHSLLSSWYFWPSSSPLSSIIISQTSMYRQHFGFCVRFRLTLGREGGSGRRALLPCNCSPRVLTREDSGTNNGDTHSAMSYRYITVKKPVITQEA